ncbi:MAG TPA: phage protein Gp27 family protein [Candidatus Sulfotelmatobacter sp.]|nr:phage protein Gp27 family protein [Candidatus Sulfotelmatobacter sp.]
MDSENTQVEVVEGRPASPAGEKNGNGESDKEAGWRSYRRNGNVARLPKAVRDKLNRMIQDGVTYGGIIEQLGEEGKGLTSSNLSRWKDGGYQDWLMEQAWLEQTRARQEAAQDLAADFDATQVNHAALQLGSLHILEALRDLKEGKLDEKLGGNSAAFARLLNALCRASKETLQLQKYREACAQARAQLQPLKDPNRKLTEEEHRAIVRKVDEILGLGSPDSEGPLYGPRGEGMVGQVGPVGQIGQL